ncbi:MAG: sulfotransferase [Methylophilaceae bacterium]
MIARYGADRVKRGLLHFFIGKSTSALAGILAMLLVIRELSVEAFAAYSVLLAFVELLTALAGFGLAHALLRYVPELYAKHYQTSLKQLVIGSVVARTLLLLLFVAIAYLCSGKLAPHVGLEESLAAFKIFLLVVVLRSTAQFLSQILESALHQGSAQLGFSAAAMARLLGMVYLYNQGQVDLVDVIWVEAIGDGLSLLIMAAGVMRVIASSSIPNQGSIDDGSWLRSNLRKIGKFALAGYLQHLAITPYGGHTNRLLGGSMLGASAMAHFGFAQSLYEYVKRYLPAQLLVGLIRPIVVARYSKDRDFSVATVICEQVLQLNILLIGGMLVLLVVGGGDALSAISAGKYGADAFYLVVMLFVVLLLETERQQLELLIQVVGRYQYLIPSNVLLSASVLIAIVLLPTLGAVAFSIANLVGLIVANTWVQQHLKSVGFIYRHDWYGIFKIVVVFTVSTAFGAVVKFLGLPWYWACLLATTLYSALGYFMCGGVVRTFLAELLGEEAKPIKGHNQKILRRPKGNLWPLRLAYSQFWMDMGGDVKNSVLVAGVARSGTTWLSEVIAAATKSREIFEPFIVRTDGDFALKPSRLEGGSFGYMPNYSLIIPADEGVASSYYSKVKNILGGHVRSWWTEQGMKPGVYKRRVIKDIRTNLMLGWIAQSWPELKIVYVVRNPISTIQSMMERSSSGWAFDWDPSYVLQQEEFVREYLAPFKHLLEGDHDYPTRLMLRWCVENHVALTQIKDKANVKIVSYDELVKNPLLWEEVFTHIDWKFDRDKFSAQANQPSKTAAVVKNGGAKAVSGDALDMATLTKLVNQFGLSRYL